jgi:hypothetical protein
MTTQSNRGCTIATHGLLRQSKRNVKRTPAGYALYPQNHPQMCDWIFAIPPYVQPRCSNAHRAGEHNMEYRQVDPRNQGYSFTNSNYSTTARTMTRRY